MASIQKVKRRSDFAYRVLIRQAGMLTVTKTFNTKRLANKFVSEIEGDRTLLIAHTQSKSKTPLKLVIDEYLKKEFKGSRPNEYKQQLNFWIEAIGNQPIIDITNTDIIEALGTLPGHFKNATINRYIAAISVVFSYACREYGLQVNPIRKIPSLPENNERTRFLSEAERTSLFKACRASHWDKLYLIVLLAITTGARKGGAY